MPLFRLITREPDFPDPEFARDDGLLAVGGALTEDWLLSAYENGIFPWFSEGDPILWWSPDPRSVLFPGEVYIAKSMRSVLRNPAWEFSFDTDFDTVIERCALISRKGEDGTWITDEMREAYGRLHRLGMAHSAEVRIDGVLVGGLYGVSIGAAFFGESMFSEVPNASKYALIQMCRRLERLGFHFVDCQLPTTHLAAMGAEEMRRNSFLKLLGKAMREDTLRGNWQKYSGDNPFIRSPEQGY